jgi:hypothetical protein
MKTDFTVQDEGSLILLHPQSTPAREWVNEHIGEDNGFQPYFPTIVIEPRYFGDILNGIIADGLAVE